MSLYGQIGVTGIALGGCERIPAVDIARAVIAFPLFGRAEITHKRQLGRGLRRDHAVMGITGAGKQRCDGVALGILCGEVPVGHHVTLGNLPVSTIEGDLDRLAGGQPPELSRWLQFEDVAVDMGDLELVGVELAHVTNMAEPEAPARCRQRLGGVISQGDTRPEAVAICQGVIDDLILEVDSLTHPVQLGLGHGHGGRSCQGHGERHADQRTSYTHCYRPFWLLIFLAKQG